jgi:Skp family chaperone for outer membrane proteins
MKNFLAIGGAVIIVLAVAAARPRTAGPSTVTVSIQRVSAQSDVGKRANQQLEAIRQERGRELTAKQRELEDVVRQLTRAEALTSADRERLIQDESGRRAELQQLTQQAQTAFQAAQTKLLTEIRGQLAPILADIAKRYGTDVVLNSDAAVAWSAPGTDTTDEVLRRLNALPQ